MSSQTDRPMVRLTSQEQIPAHMTEREAREFWDSHEITDAYLDDAPVSVEEELPATRARTRPVAIRFDEDTLRRLRLLARRKGKGYQTLLKEFVAERLYEEEKREHLVG